MDWDLFGWVNRGARRKQILLILAKSSKPITVNEIKKKSNIAMAQASYTIKELLNQKLITCLNSNDKIGRLYTISEKGKMIADGL